MNAIRKTVKIEGNSLKVDLPDEFKDQEVDIEVTLHKVEKESISKEDKDLQEYHQSIRDHYKDIRVDLSNYKFNRDELYER